MLSVTVKTLKITCKLCVFLNSKKSQLLVLLHSVTKKQRKGISNGNLIVFTPLNALKWWNSFQEYDDPLWMGKKADAATDSTNGSRHSYHCGLWSTFMYRWQFWQHYPVSETKFICEDNSKLIFKAVVFCCVDSFKSISLWFYTSCGNAGRLI